MTAEERGMAMMHLPIRGLPQLAQRFAKKLCSEVGMCMEVLLTAWTVYAQCVEKLPCTDDLYRARPIDVSWFEREKVKFVEEALKELVSHYHMDRVSPGLQLSWLQEKGKFYVAIHRFPGDVQSRQVISKALAESVDMALEQAMANWRGIIAQLEAEKKS